MNHCIHPARTCFHPRLLLLTCALGCWCLAGCKALMSTSLGTHRYDGRPAEGMAYCLPTGRVEIEVVKVTTTTTVADDTPAAPAAPAPGNSEGTPNIPPKDGKKATGGADNQTANSLLPAVKESEQTPPASTAQTGKKTNDAAGGNPISGAPSPPQAKKNVVVSTAYKIRYKSTTYVPDHSKSFAVRYKGNGMSDDNIHITVGKNSLLDLIEVTTEDKSVEITKKLLEIGKNIAKIALAHAGGTTVSEDVIFSGSFDPTDTSDWIAMCNDLKTVHTEGGKTFSIEVNGHSTSRSAKTVNSCHVNPADQTMPITPGQAYDGVVFRPAAPYTLTLKYDGAVQQRVTVMLPNKSEMLYMPINRSAFIKKVQKLDFEDGMLVEASITKPSEVLGGMEIPLEVTRAILSLPGEIIADNVAAMKGKQGSAAQALQTYQAERALSRAATDEDTKDAQSILQKNNAVNALQP